MGMGCTRVLERVRAAVGDVNEAPSRFEKVVDVSNGGMLLALPALLANGLLLNSETLFRLPDGYYGQIHIFLLLDFMALARIKTPEQLRYASPGEWGKLLGLDRIPEVRTLREKVKCLAQGEQVREWPESEFRNYRVAMPSGDEVNMKLAERGIYSRKKIRLREIRKLTESGRQTSVVSTDYISDLPVTGAHMFSRWSHENFFKYMLHHFEIDGLAGYRTEAVSDTKKVVNPVYRRQVGRIRSKQKGGRSEWRLLKGNIYPF